MRKIAVLLMSFCLTMTVCAQKFKTTAIGGAELEFEVLKDQSGEVALTSGKNMGATKLEIPSSVFYNSTEYQVTVLEKYSLKDCDEKLRELIFPSSIREIEGALFVNTSTESVAGTVAAKYFTLGIAGSVKRESKLNKVELANLQISKNTKIIGEDAFLTRCSLVKKSKKTPLKAHISELPDFVTPETAERYGLSQVYVKEYWDKGGGVVSTRSDHDNGHVLPPRPVETSVSKITGTSDVDTNIPKMPETNKNTFAVIIANEVYQREAKVDFALNDGSSFKDYCRKVLGMPEKNIHYVENATLNNVIFELDWLKKVCDAYKGAASVIIYYAGHGVPDEATGKSYLLPVDGSGQNIRTCYALDDFYKTVGEMQANHVTIFLDACFSGAKRNGEMQTAARGVAIKAKATAPQGKLVVFSAATGDETAYSYKEQNHGLFTYFLLKKLKDSKGNTTLGELADYINEQVGQYSIVENGKSQTPTVSQSAVLRQGWRNQKLK